MNELLKRWLSASKVDRKRALRRLRLVNAALSAREMPHAKHDAIIKVVEHLGSSRASIYRYVAMAEEASGQEAALARLMALLPNYGNRAGTSYAFDPAAIEYALDEYCKSPLTTVSRVYSALEKEAGQRGWKIGSLDSLERIFGKR